MPISIYSMILGLDFIVGKKPNTCFYRGIFIIEKFDEQLRSTRYASKERHRSDFSQRVCSNMVSQAKMSLKIVIFLSSYFLLVLCVRK